MFLESTKAASVGYNNRKLDQLQPISETNKKAFLLETSPGIGRFNFSGIIEENEKMKQKIADMNRNLKHLEKKAAGYSEAERKVSQLKKEGYEAKSLANGLKRELDVAEKEIAQLKKKADSPPRKKLDFDNESQLESKLHQAEAQCRKLQQKFYSTKKERDQLLKKLTIMTKELEKHKDFFCKEMNRHAESAMFRVDKKTENKEFAQFMLDQIVQRLETLQNLMTQSPGSSAQNKGNAKLQKVVSVSLVNLLNLFLHGEC